MHVKAIRMQINTVTELLNAGRSLYGDKSINIQHK